MSTVLDYVAATNTLTVSDNGTVVNVAGSGVDNNFSVPQTFGAGIAVSGATTLAAVSGTTGTFTGAVSVSGFSNAGNTTLQAVSGTTGTFTGAVSVSGFSNAGNTSLQAVSGTTGTFTGAVTALANAITTSGSLAGTTAGTVDYSMPDQGVAKKFVAFFNAYENDTTVNQTITFPVSFVNTPAVGINTTGLTVSGSTTTEVVIAAPDATTLYTGVLTFEGI